MLTQGYFTAGRARAGRSRIIELRRERVVHASYTWFMDRGPYSDTRAADTRPMERSK